MLQANRKWIFGLILATFALLNAVLIWKEFYWFAALPVALLIVAVAFVRIDNFLILISFLTPLSVTLEDMNMGAALSLPAEPLIISAMFVFAAKLFIQGNYDKRIVLHPIGIAIVLHLLWMLMTTVYSEYPLVSAKFLISRLWFVSVFYFLGGEVFKEKKNIYRFLWAHVLGVLIVIFYTTYQHAIRGFEKQPGHWVMSPFYHDHTAYGMILALLLPFLFGYSFKNKHSLIIKILIFGVLISFLVAFRLSNTRAAWLSIVAAMGVYFLIRFKIRWYVVTTAAVLAIGAFVLIQDQLFINLGRNKQDSSDNLQEHIQSMSNISTDASNLERLNRWDCALSMFEERPIFGWGPNTYKFVYARFQKSTHVTLISTNAGNLGNAHSEYLGPLSEQGILGLLFILGIFGAIIYTGNRVYQRSKESDLKSLAMWITLSFTTYFVHGVLNNFLELDKASVPFWAMAGMLLAMDLNLSSEKEQSI